MGVIHGATETPRVAKFEKRDSARRTLFLIEFPEFLLGLSELQLLRERSRDGLNRTGFVFLQNRASVMFTQVQDLRPARLSQFGDVEGGGFVAILTFHG